MSRIESLHIYSDGASRGNPGKAAIAFIIEDQRGHELKRYSEPIGIKTNNIAEYTAIIKALKYASKYSPLEILCFSDSELVVNQLNGNYKVKKKHLTELFLKVKDLMKLFPKVTFSNLPRTNPKIGRVDKLVNKELDKLD